METDEQLMERITQVWDLVAASEKEIPHHVFSNITQALDNVDSTMQEMPSLSRLNAKIAALQEKAEIAVRQNETDSETITALEKELSAAKPEITRLKNTNKRVTGKYRKAQDAKARTESNMTAFRELAERRLATITRLKVEKRKLQKRNQRYSAEFTKLGRKYLETAAEFALWGKEDEEDENDGSNNTGDEMDEDEEGEKEPADEAGETGLKMEVEESIFVTALKQANAGESDTEEA